MHQVETPVVDLRSDTVTRPDQAMRAAISRAEVGDHVLGDDPTAAELERVAAELLGKERALFFPSGIMANQTAILVQTRPGTEVLLDSGAHILNYEEGGAAAWAGVQLRAVAAPDGLPDPEAFAGGINPPSRFLPQCSLISLENTHNSAGGRVIPLELMADVAQVARDRGVAVHLDGARLPNAAVATGQAMREWAAVADTVMVSLSKGLGAPVGSLLAGPAPLMEAGWRIRRRLGGGMRQAGILAAAGLHALRHNYERLVEDHRRAADLMRGVAGMPGLHAAAPDTNIVMIDVDPGLGTANDLIGALERHGVWMSSFGPQRLRAVTHLDIDDTGIERAIRTLALITGHPQ